MTEFSPVLREYILAFADDEHLMGQRHTEWIGVTPFLEEDLAFASIGQDELGHAADLYSLLVGDDDTAIDELAFRRPPEQYRSCWLVEHENADWAEALVRHWLYDSVERHRWALQADSSVPALAALVERAEREESYHRRHADGLLDVLLAVDESRRRIEYAMTVLWPLAKAVFDGVAGESELVEEGVIAAPLADRFDSWRSDVVERFPSIDFDGLDGAEGVEDIAAAQQNRTARHSGFEAVYGRMREVLKFDPEAVW